MRSPRAVLAVLFALAVTSCRPIGATPRSTVAPTNPPASAPSAPAATASPAPAEPSPTQDPSAAPFVPGAAWEPFGEPILVDAGDTSARTNVDGVRVSIVAASSRFTTADGLWVITTLENTGNDTLRWSTDGCAIHVGVRAVTGFDWTYGAVQTGPFGLFKDWALERTYNWEPFPIGIASTPERLLDDGDFACADMGFGHSLPPGERIRERILVDPESPRSRDYGPVPPGPVRLTAVFDRWYRGSAKPDPVLGPPITASIAVDLVDGRDAALLSPGQAVDAALQSDPFQALLLQYPRIPLFSPTILRFDDERDTWEVGATFFDRVRGEYVVTLAIDGRSGEITRVVGFQ